MDQRSAEADRGGTEVKDENGRAVRKKLGSLTKRSARGTGPFFPYSSSTPGFSCAPSPLDCAMDFSSLASAIHTSLHLLPSRSCLAKR